MDAPARPPRRGAAPGALLVLALLAGAAAPRPAAAALPSCNELVAAHKKNGYSQCAVLREKQAALLWKKAGDAVTLKPVYAVAAQGDLGWLGIGFSDFGSMKGGRAQGRGALQGTAVRGRAAGGVCQRRRRAAAGRPGPRYRSAPGPGGAARRARRAARCGASAAGQARIAPACSRRR
jgi:hypothetical protein